VKISVASETLDLSPAKDTMQCIEKNEKSGVSCYPGPSLGNKNSGNYGFSYSCA
jgi:hypothetical protein